jgi:hypothetical protein
MYFADTVGLRKVHETVARFYREQGEWMRPAPLLEKLAREHGMFQPTART